MIDVWHIWVMVGIVLAISEIFIPAFAVMCLAIGAFGSAAVAGAGYDWQIQATVFAGVSLFSALTIRPVALRLFFRSSVGDDVDSIVGKKAMVTEEIPGAMERGKVKIEGEVWNAISEIDLPIPTGKSVTITKIDGNKLVVEMEKE